jgi:CheY-like chemotaxis protein
LTIRDAGAMLARMTRVLIADDDPISLRFLEAALQRLGCATVVAADTTSALRAAASTPCDLLMLDCNMPGGGALELLAELRARTIMTPAIATSADASTQIIAELRAAGFAAFVAKPVTLAALRNTLLPWLPEATTPAKVDGTPVAAALLDDAAALTTIGGDADALRALRAMLVQELATLQADLASANADPVLLRERLHRLRASCGFCGTPSLAAAAAALDHALHANSDTAPAELRAFAMCCTLTLEALHNASVG